MRYLLLFSLALSALSSCSKSEPKWDDSVDMRIVGIWTSEQLNSDGSLKATRTLVVQPPQNGKTRASYKVDRGNNSSDYYSGDAIFDPSRAQLGIKSSKSMVLLYKFEQGKLHVSEQNYPREPIYFKYEKEKF